MAAPVLIGAGIGAATSLATGRNVGQGALMGGVTGGLFGGPESLFYDDIFGGMASSGIKSGISDTAFNTALDSVDDIAASGFGVQITPEMVAKASVDETISGIPYEALGNEIVGYAPDFSVGVATKPYEKVRENIFLPESQGGAFDTSLLSQDDPMRADRLDRLAFKTPYSAMDKIKNFGSGVYDWAKNNPMQAGIGTLGLLSVLDSSQTTLPSSAGGGSIKPGDPGAVSYSQQLKTYVPERKQYKIG